MEMTFEKSQQFLRNNDIWIISKGRPAKFDLSAIDNEIQTNFVTEYWISDLARYLLNPNPIEVRKILVGCDIYYKQEFSDKARNRIRSILSGRFKPLIKEATKSSITLMASRDKGGVTLKDSDLNAHVQRIHASLRAYDPLIKQLNRLDRTKLTNIVGICEDIGGNRSLLNLKGDIEEKINYMGNFLQKDVGVILERANVSQGLFEMSGFDFNSYNAKNSHRLIKFFAEGRPRYCVINVDGNLEFWINDANLINHMHLLEHSIKVNPKFNNSLSLCTQGNARPLRLLFKDQLEIDYTKSPLPSLYKDIFTAYHIGETEKDAVMKSLKNSQLGILFNYVPTSNSGAKKLFTNVSVLHDVRALDPIKERLPELYSMINKMAMVSEAGKYYLLDSIKGYSNE
ncbi:conserved hypothetical protein [uncultured Desulfobacterium sp.]|uniref:Uncharacterized protein n=1 Tax=uncultured Desulfobacterium sp. TaxID=201089 RepID=A0A445N1Z6_9BACT|nr:conserved hypothetical protein [uncultured Desulfobacterium sp.]